jgi:hypothetical protein
METIATKRHYTAVKLCYSFSLDLLVIILFLEEKNTLKKWLTF